MNIRVEIIMHPIRLRIILALVNRQLTSLELAEILKDVPQATLYRHVKTLHEADLLEVVEERKVRNTTEKVYTLAHGGAALSPEELLEASPEDHMTFFAVFVSSLLADFSRYIESPGADPLKDGVGYRQVALNLTDEELFKMVTEINAAIVPMLGNKLTKGRKRKVFSTILIPDDHEPPHTGGEKDGA